MQSSVFFKNKEEGDETGVSLSFPKLVDIFESEGQEAIGRELLLDDGIISLVVKSVNPESIVCTVNKGGVLKTARVSIFRATLSICRM